MKTVQPNLISTNLFLDLLAVIGNFFSPHEAPQQVSQRTWVDFSRVDFARVDFSRIDFAWVDFSRDDFARVDFARIDFARVDFAWVDFSWVDFCQVDFAWVDFARVDLAEMAWIADIHWGREADPNFENVLIILVLTS